MSETAFDFHHRLRTIEASDPAQSDAVAALAARVADAEPARGGDALWSWRAIILALEAAARGNYGVGALIVDETAPERPSVAGANAMFAPRFDSGAHAEMRAIDAFEAQEPTSAAAYGAPLTLFTSLEPCPMCLSRFIGSRIGALKYVARDEGGGMVERLEAMPPVWRAIASAKQIGRAACGRALETLAFEVFELSARRLDAELARRG